jgi:5-formyltetrahydrofolate cyclo-ligase
LKDQEKEDQKSNERILLNNCFYRGTKLLQSTSWNKDYNVNHEKRRIRCEMLSARVRLSENEVNKKSDTISKNLFSFHRYKQAKNIALYASTNNEVKTDIIFNHAKERGMKVYFPRIEGPVLKFHEIENLVLLYSGKFGIPEPTEYYPITSAEDLDLVIIPGIAFDPYGRRIGYGKGYYDRSIKPISIEKRVGLAFSFQILDSVPACAGGSSLGIVITELGIFSCKRGIGGT